MTLRNQIERVIDMKTNIVGIIAGTIGLCFLGAGNESEVPNEAQTHDQAKTISWDQKTLTLIAEWGTYGRMIRLTSGNILCAFARRGTVWTSRSIDEGKTWNAPAMAVTYEFGAATNPEILELVDGWILLSYNERPRDGKNHFAIRTCLSKDAGETWTAHSIVYEADTHWENGCWEPAQIQLPSGQIQLYFANENPYRYSNEQEISMVRSEDNGLTWSKPTTISFRAHHRDGMPVPLILSNGKGIVVAIEDNALHGKFRPAIVCTSMKCNWNQPYVDGSSPQRWWALAAAARSAGGHWLILRHQMLMWPPHTYGSFQAVRPSYPVRLTKDARIQSWRSISGTMKREASRERRFLSMLTRAKQASGILCS
jgi:hypothetical protein